MKAPKISSKQSFSECEGKFCKMIKEFERTVFGLETLEFFDQPSAARMLTGVARSFNEFTE